MDEKLLRTMRAAGCYMIAYGVESGDQKILSEIGKNIVLDQIVRAFDLTHKARINTVAYFMLGSPNETTETIKRTIEYAKTLNPDFVQFSIATPYPGTELYHLVSGKDRLQKSWENYVYADLKSVRGSFSETRIINGRNLRTWNRKAYVSFYLRRRYIWNRLKKITSFDELKTNVAGFRLLFEMVM